MPSSTRLKKLKTLPDKFDACLNDMKLIHDADRAAFAKQANHWHQSGLEKLFWRKRTA
jgi:hypothetical protein